MTRGSLSTLFLSAISSFAFTLPLAAVTDGPYVEWTSAKTVQVESVCDSELIRENLVLNGTRRPSIVNPCNGEVVAPLVVQHEIPQDTYTGVTKYLALSDVEGHYPELLQLLTKHGVIDENLNWSWDQGHLIFVGDSVDRGDQVTEVLWFIYRLSSEAEKVGGRVHFLLGNHDVMALKGDDRYLNDKYEDSFKLMGKSYDEVFSKNSEFGRWFRSRNVMLKLDDTVFVHAGLSPSFTELGLSLNEVNRYIRAGLNDLSLEESNSTIDWLLSSKGPTWYRGYFEDENLKLSEIEGPLKALNASRVVVGHTIVDEIGPLHEGRVIAIDTAFSKPKKVSALLFDNGRYYRAKIGGKTPISLEAPR